MEVFRTIQTVHKGKFMAYKESFLSNNYYYIRSVKMIAFHAAFMLLSILGTVVSVSAFPSAYGRT